MNLTCVRPPITLGISLPWPSLPKDVQGALRNLKALLTQMGEPCRTARLIFETTPKELEGRLPSEVASLHRLTGIDFQVLIALNRTLANGKAWSSLRITTYPLQRRPAY